VLPVGWVASVTLALTSAVGAFSFLWPFFISAGLGDEHAGDAPWLFVLLMALMAGVAVAQIAAGGLDAKTVAVLGVLAATGGALRVLGAGTAGLEPMFFLLVVAGRVLGRGMGFLLGAMAVLVGGFLTGGIGPWVPFQMFAAGWVTLGAACLPRASGWAERWLLAAYGLVAGLGYGVVMNLWFWPFLVASGDITTTDGVYFVAGEPMIDNLRRYLVFYLATSLGWDLPRGLLTAILCLVGAGPVLATLRRALRRANFDAAATFEASPSAPLSKSRDG
jgi:energy-coupling factor transport system substrate-specific component